MEYQNHMTATKTSSGLGSNVPATKEVRLTLRSKRNQISRT
jgi:hypothetical protein